MGKADLDKINKTDKIDKINDRVGNSDETHRASGEKLRKFAPKRIIAVACAAVLLFSAIGFEILYFQKRDSDLPKNSTEANTSEGLPTNSTDSDTRDSGALPPYSLDSDILAIKQATNNQSPAIEIKWPDSWPAGYPENIDCYFARELEGLDDNTLLRVSFQFFDNSVMERVKQDGYTLQSIAKEYLDKVYFPWTINSAIYNIEMTFAETDDNYYLKYKSAYELIIKESDPSWKEDYKNIFGSEDLYNQYLNSPAFQSEYPNFFRVRELKREIRDILKKREYINNPAIGETYQSYLNELQEKQTLSFVIPEEKQKKYIDIASKIWPLLSKLLYEKVKNEFDFIDLEHFDFKFNPCGQMTASMTKAQILALAKSDSRFYFTGIGYYVRPEGYNENISTDLALLLATSNDVDATYTVNLIPKNFSTETQSVKIDNYTFTRDMLGRINYNYCLTYQWGFIKDLRKQYNSNFHIDELISIPNFCYQISLKASQILDLSENNDVLYMDLPIDMIQYPA